MTAFKVSSLVKSLRTACHGTVRNGVRKPNWWIVSGVPITSGYQFEHRLEHSVAGPSPVWCAREPHVFLIDTCVGPA